MLQERPSCSLFALANAFSVRGEACIPFTWAAANPMYVCGFAASSSSQKQRPISATERSLQVFPPIVFGILCSGPAPRCGVAVYRTLGGKCSTSGVSCSERVYDELMSGLEIGKRPWN